jgi:DNA-binding transcriptional MerR regulator
MPKSTPPTSPTATDDAYRIAAVSRLTGMPIPTIRMWERRYGVVSPARSAGNGRLYSRADIDRLTLLKAAVDAGHAIGTVASLSDEQIQARLSEALPRPLHSPRQQCLVAVQGAALTERLSKAWADRSDIRLIEATEQPDEAGERPDALIAEVNTLNATALKSLRQLRARSRAALTIVVYGFGTRQALARLDQEGIIALGMPADPSHLARICHLGLSMQGPETAGIEQQLLQPAAARRYDDRFLATVARLPTTVRCECPNHLADLLTKLNAFEQYSLECESSDPADASVHALLYAAAAHCRELLEHALQRVLAHEGIADLPTGEQTPAQDRPA